MVEESEPSSLLACPKGRLEQLPEMGELRVPLSPPLYWSHGTHQASHHTPTQCGYGYDDGGGGGGHN